MCGIAGIISHKTYGFSSAQQKMVYQLLWADVFRGSDATGVIGVMNDGEFAIMKHAVSADYFDYSFRDSKLDKALFQRGRALIGHNRAKTIGKNEDENAHPFVENNTFAMVHNGTLRNHADLVEQKCDVDSQALTILFQKAMEQEDWKDAMEDALGKINGAFACVWYDQKRHQVCMIRNKERPLCLVIGEDTTLFASEGPMASWIGWRNNEKIKDTVFLKEHTLYQFDLSKAGGDFSETNLSPKKTTRTARQPIGAATTGISRPHKSIDDWAANTAKPVSKNAFKKERPFLVGKPIKFELDDFFSDSERPTRASIIGYCLDGSLDLVEHRHEVSGTVYYKDGLDDQKLINAKHLVGIIHEVHYNKKDQKLVLDVVDIRLEEEAVV